VGAPGYKASSPRDDIFPVVVVIIIATFILVIFILLFVILRKVIIPKIRFSPLACIR
jgi:hypothetical protein